MNIPLRLFLNVPFGCSDVLFSALRAGLMFMIL